MRKHFEPVKKSDWKAVSLRIRLLRMQTFHLAPIVYSALFALFLKELTSLSRSQNVFKKLGKDKTNIQNNKNACKEEICLLCYQHMKRCTVNCKSVITYLCDHRFHFVLLFLLSFVCFVENIKQCNSLLSQGCGEEVLEWLEYRKPSRNDTRSVQG